MPEAENLTGKKLGDYEILGIVGRGGMAVVYKARQLSLDRMVALKVLLTEFGRDKPFVQRFIREARSAASLRHPNIVQIHDIAEIENLHFFCMEYVEGHTISEVIHAEGALPPDRVLPIAKQVVSALACAHAQQIIHRDIKSSNIMIDRSDRVTVTDFGLAKPIHSRGVTQTGALVGTPEYMSPEQCVGTAVDERTDLYSLGVVLFEMLTGKIPFEADTLPGIVHKQVYEQPHPLDELAPQTPDRLVRVVHKLLEKRKEDRYQKAQDVLGALESISGISPPSGPARARPFTDMETVVSEEGIEWDKIDKKPTSSSWGRWAILGAVALALAATATLFFSKKTEPLTKTSPVPTPKPTSPSAAPVPTATPRPSPTQWTVVVESEPKGASVWLDGKDTGKKTTASIEIPGKSGELHDLQLKLEGYHAEKMALPLKERQAPVRFALKKEEPAVKPGTLILQVPWASGSGTEVQMLIDGKNKRIYRGETSWTGLSPGRHTLTVKCIDPYVNHTQTVKVASQEKAKIVLDFNFARLFATPRQWCHLIVNGEKVGDTPISNHRIAPGEYDIEFQSPTGKRWVAKGYDIKGGLDVNLHYDLPPFREIQ